MHPPWSISAAEVKVQRGRLENAPVAKGHAKVGHKLQLEPTFRSIFSAALYFTSHQVYRQSFRSPDTPHIPSHPSCSVVTEHLLGSSLRLPPPAHRATKEKPARYVPYLLFNDAPEGLVALLGGEGSGRGGAEGRKGEGKLDHGGDGGSLQQPKSTVSVSTLLVSTEAGPTKKFRKRCCTTS